MAKLGFVKPCPICKYEAHGYTEDTCDIDLKDHVRVKHPDVWTLIKNEEDIVTSNITRKFSL